MMLPVISTPSVSIVFPSSMEIVDVHFSMKVGGGGSEKVCFLNTMENS